MLLMIYVQMVSFAVALVCGIVFLATGRKNRVLSVAMGVFLLIGVLAQFLGRSA